MVCVLARHGAALALCLCVLGIFAFLSSPVAAAEGIERIRDFDSLIVVNPDGALTVTETITVESRGRKIKRGIYRDFPTTYKGRYGNIVTVGFQVLEVRRDGLREPFHTEKRSNGVRLYLGRSDVFIPDGEHSYTIVYRTERQLGFFDEFDELYWNATGSDWDFDIDRASALVVLPPGAEVLDWAAYTGRPGERGQDFVQTYDTSGGGIRLTTIRSLRPGEGFTVAVSWPKGFVTAPTAAEELGYILRDNGAFAAGLGGFAVLLLYFLAAWGRVGRDPEKGTIVAEYDPPKGFSPAAARYVTRMGFDDKAFTSAVVSMAVKGFLKITEDEDKEYTLEKTGRRADLSAGEKALARHLFRNGQSQIVLEQSNHEILQKAQKALRASLKTDFEKIYFLRNTRYFVPGLIITLVAIVVIVAFASEPMVAGPLSIWLAAWSAGCYFLLRRVIAAWRTAGSAGGFVNHGGALFITVFALPFFAAELFALGTLANATSVLGAAALFGILLLNLVFYHLLKAPTRLGRRVMDRIEGFRHYLSVAEKDRMNFHNPPERTPELFERFLPFALALGVEQAWSEQFSQVLSAAGSDPDAGRGYRPGWYSGRSYDSRNLTGFASGLGGGFSSAIASASTAPGSSGGSGGGGSSGGGGGGGGGGGW